MGQVRSDRGAFEEGDRVAVVRLGVVVVGDERSRAGEQTESPRCPGGIARFREAFERGCGGSSSPSRAAASTSSGRAQFPKITMSSS